MICRSCGYKTIKIHSTPLLPECIWPSSYGNYTLSKCNVYSCVKCHHLQLQNFSKKKILSFYGTDQLNLDKTETHNKRLLDIKNNFGKNFFLKKEMLDVGGGVNPIIKNKKLFIADFKIQQDVKNFYKEHWYELDIERQKINHKFDIIFLIHTLEHFKNPKLAISNIKRSLKDEGRIFIEVPNFDYYTKKNTYYSIFHQHLSMFTLKHLSNLLHINDLYIEKVITKTNIIFCSVKKNFKKKKKLNKINNIFLLRKLDKNYKEMQKKILQHLNKEKYDVYGSGGSMVLALSSINKITNKINFIFDNDKKKNNKIFPTTKIKIFKFTKKFLKSEIKSISCYELNKKRNLNIQKI